MLNPSRDLVVVQRWATDDGRPYAFEAHSIFTAATRGIAQDAVDWVAHQPQRDRAWKNLRGAFVTGSAIATCCGLGYGGREATMRAFDTLARTWFPAAQEETAAMRYGTEHEDTFFRAYSALVATVKKTGLAICPTPGRGHFAASPDGLVVGDDGLIEIKITQKQRNDQLWDNWICQVQLAMMCTGRQWCDILGCALPRGNRIGTEASDRSRMTMWHVPYSQPFADAICDAATRFVEKVDAARTASARVDPETDLIIYGPINHDKLSIFGPFTIDHVLYRANEEAAKQPVIV